MKVGRKERDMDNTRSGTCLHASCAYVKSLRGRRFFRIARKRTLLALAGIALLAGAYLGFGGRSRSAPLVTVDGLLRVGQLAPDFELFEVAGGRYVRLSAVRDKKPVVLIFGSLT